MKRNAGDYVALAISTTIHFAVSVIAGSVSTRLFAGVRGFLTEEIHPSALPVLFRLLEPWFGKSFALAVSLFFAPVAILWWAKIFSVDKRVGLRGSDILVFMLFLWLLFFVVGFAIADPFIQLLTSCEI